MHTFLSTQNAVFQVAKPRIKQSHCTYFDTISELAEDSLLEEV